MDHAVIESIKDNPVSENNYLHSGVYFKYYEKESYVLCSGNSSLDFKIMEKLNENNNVLFKINENKTLVIDISNQYFHFIIDVLTPIISFHKEDKNINIILIVARPKDLNDPYYSYLSFLKRFLKDCNINNDFVEIADCPILFLKKFYLFVGRGIVHRNTTKNILEYTNKYIKDKNKKPDKKIYLDRSKVVEHDTNILLNGRNINEIEIMNDKRIDDYLEVKNFFVSKGFDVINPEDIQSFEEQIDLIHSAKVLVSITGAGLANLVFMEPNQTVIELSTMLLANGVESLHQPYWILSHVGKLNYISIPHDRIAKDLINNLQNFLIGEL